MVCSGLAGVDLAAVKRQRWVDNSGGVERRSHYNARYLHRWISTYNIHAHLQYICSSHDTEQYLTGVYSAGVKMESRWSWLWWRYCGHRTSAAVTLSQLPAVSRVTCHEWPLWILSYSGATCRQCCVPPNSGYWSDHMGQVHHRGEDGGWWWWVKQNYSEVLPVKSNILKTLSSTFSACQKGFAQCPCFKAILFLVCHVYSDNIWRQNAPDVYVLPCARCRYQQWVLWRVVTISVTRDSDQLPGDMCSASQPSHVTTILLHLARTLTRTPAPAISNS